MVPTEGEGDCFKIIQVENSSLNDLTAVFLAAVKGYSVPAGTVVLLSSVSHLAAVGTAAYAADLVGAFQAIRKLYGDAIVLQHGVPLLISGVDSHSIIRSMLEIESWYKQLTLSSTVEISNTHTAFCTSLAKTSIASTNPAPGSAPEMVLLKMPQKLKVESTDYNVTSVSVTR
jgi:hypothetical protein